MPPPEVEIQLDFELPHAGERFVYVANPESDTVAVIEAQSLAIDVVEAGDEPRYLQTLAGQDQAIVLNVASDDATLIRTDDAGSRTAKVDVLPGSNAIAVAADGAHAVAYFNAAHSAAGQPSGSYQDVTLITLDPAGDRSVGMTVGFRPSAVFFSTGRAFVVTEDGVSILDFADIEANGPGIAPTIPIADPAIARTLDVSITPDGRYALARAEGDSVLRLLDLDSGEVQLLDVAGIGADAPAADGGVPQEAGAPIAQPDAQVPADPGDAQSPLGDAAPSGGDATPTPTPPPTSTGTGTPDPATLPSGVTDLDLSPTDDFALAVLRDRSLMLKLPIPEAFTDPSTISVTEISREFIGSVEISPDGRFAVLFTTAHDLVERLTIVDLSSGAERRVQLRKSVLSVTIAPDGTTALVVHQKLPGDPGDPSVDNDGFIDRSFGYSLVNLETGFPKLQLTETELGPFAITPDGGFLFVLFNSAAIRQVQRVRLSDFIVDTTDIGSPPLSVGAVPGSQRVFIGQEHPDGRISFVDWETGDVRSVTGFELNSRIRE